MKALLKLSFQNYNGNLIWAGKYVYPQSHLEAGISELRQKGYWISSFPEGDGLTFKIREEEEETFNDFEIAFPWMNIKCYQENEEFNFAQDLNNEQIIILPLSRLKIDHPIYSKNLCIFPLGEFSVKNLNMQIPEKVDLNNLPKFLPNNRAFITSLTEIDETAFTQNAVVVFRDSVTIEDYVAMQQGDDVELIKKYSERAESALDLIRFFECNYTVPEFLPAKAGIWDDRYSTALVYFPIYDIGIVQSREVEIKTFIKGIGTDIHSGLQINHLPIFLYDDDELGEVGKFCKYALKLNTAIAESDNQSIKFIQIMTLLEFIGDPYGYRAFKDIKGKIIAYIAKDKSDYHRLSQDFIYYSKELRTEIIHNGKRIEDLLSNSKILGIFEFFHKTTYTIIWDLMMHYDMSWADYQDERKLIQDEFTD